MIEFELLPPAFTNSATSFSAYYLNLTFKSLRVNLVPYFPANGDVLTLIVTPIKGSSILRQGITFYGYVYSTNVCVTFELGNPAIETISPI